MGWQGVRWRKEGGKEKRVEEKELGLMECKLRETHSSSGQTVIPVKVNNNFVS